MPITVQETPTISATLPSFSFRWTASEAKTIDSPPNRIGMKSKATAASGKEA